MDPETGAPWSDCEIARRCSVGYKFVAKIRAPLTEDIPTEVRAYQDRYGNVTQMRTASIGRKLEIGAVEGPTGCRSEVAGGAHPPTLGDAVRGG